MDRIASPTTATSSENSDDGRYVTVIHGSWNEIYISSDYGQSFSKATVIGDTTNKTLGSLAMSGTGQYQAIGLRNRALGANEVNVVVSSDYGRTWDLTNITKGTGKGGCSVAVSQSGQYILAGCFTNSAPLGEPHCRVYVSPDYGASWRQTNLTIVGLLPGLADIVMSPSGERMFILANSLKGNFLVSSHDFGTTWTIASLPMGGAPEHIAAAAAGEIVFIPSAATGLMCIFASRDSGVTWSKYCNASWADVSGISVSENGQAVHVATNTSLYVSNDFGASFDEINATVPLPPVSFHAFNGLQTSMSGQYQIQTVDMKGFQKVFNTSVILSSDNGVSWCAIFNYTNEIYSQPFAINRFSTTLKSQSLV